MFALGDCFPEIVSPARPDTAAGRYLDRHGRGGGYMVIFDLEDLEAARERARQLACGGAPESAQAQYTGGFPAA